jgi:hypothetical protein
MGKKRLDEIYEEEAEDYRAQAQQYQKNFIKNKIGFRSSIIKGNAACEIVRGLLEDSGYTVYPFGYESTFSSVKNQIHKKKEKESLTAKKIRSMPDLLVENSDNIHLIEVKFRSSKNIWKEGKKRVKCFDLPLSQYYEHWKEAVLIIVTDHWYRFYCCDFGSLEEKSKSIGSDKIPLSTFTRIEDVFENVDAQLLKEYEKLIKEILC